MSKSYINASRGLQQILWACYDFWKESDQPPDDREICYEWIIDRYEKKFGASFSQERLRRLATLGRLEAGDAAGDGKGQYYRLVDPNEVASDLKIWGF